MSLIALIAQTLESGKIRLSTKNKEDLEITAANSRIDVNAKNKQFLKELLSSLREAGGKQNIAKAIKQAPSTLSDFRELLAEVAEELKAAGITVTLSYKGDLVVTVGSQAHSRLARFLIKTEAVEINNLAKLIEIGI